MNTTAKEEDYLKHIADLSEWGKVFVSTKSLSERMETTPAAVTDMLKKLSWKKLVVYQKYQGVKLSIQGDFIAKIVARKQRLWQSFLVSTLKFSLDEISEVSEQLEHINSKLLFQRLDDYLGNPTYSPFGEPIPNEDGTFVEKSPVELTKIEEGASSIIAAIKENNPTLMQYLHKKGIYVGAKIIVIERMDFDGSIDLSIDNQPKVNISDKVAQNILVSSAG